MVGIILYGSFELAPYAKKYMNILENAKIPYDLIGWRREEEARYSGENVHIYEGKAAKRYSSPIAKIMPAMGYRRYVKKLLKTGKTYKIENFVSKNGKNFSGYLKLENGRAVFDFND